MVESSASGVVIPARGKTKITVIVGGDRSGKSTYVRDYAVEAADGGRCYISTHEHPDEILKGRIESRKDNFTLIEAPVDLPEAIRNIPPDTCVCIIDDLTEWVANSIGHGREVKIDELLDALKESHVDALVVTNEYGMGKDAPVDVIQMCGKVNQKVAAIADNVIMMVCGIPLAVKGAVL